MKIPNKRKPQQIAFTYSSDTDLKGFMNTYKKCTAKPYCYLVIDTAFTSDNHVHFIKNLLQRI